MPIPYSFISPPGIDPAQAEANATTAFISWLGLASCSAGDFALGLIPVSNITVANNVNATGYEEVPFSNQTSVGSIVSTPLVSSSPVLAPPDPSLTAHQPRGLSKRTRAIIITFTILGSLGLGVIGILLLRRYRRRRSSVSPETENKEENGQPYLQRKAELEAEEKRKQELEALEIRYEADGDHGIHELPSHETKATIPQLQKLRGPEHFTELEVPTKA